MRDILSGGVLATTDTIGSLARKPALSRRLRPARDRLDTRPVMTRAQELIQPGQLSSPRLQFGFPSLLMH